MYISTLIPNRSTMQKLFWLLVALTAFSCSKADKSRFSRLQRTEATSYNGGLVTTEYKYDGQSRITSILKKKDSAAATVMVTISYSGNEAVLVSFPDTDPSYTQQKEVRYLLDADGKPSKRFSFTLLTSKSGPGNYSLDYRNDTTSYEYDAGSLLVKSIRRYRDSLWFPSGKSILTTATFTITFINSNGNLVSTDEYVTYLRTDNQGGVPSVSGGSSEYKNAFEYSKSFPNNADFKNAFVLNEYLDYYQVPVNERYKNMPDRIQIDNRDWDLNGNVIFKATGGFDMKRVYNEQGLLSALIIPAGNTQDTVTRYFYERY